MNTTARVGVIVLIVIVIIGIFAMLHMHPAPQPTGGQAMNQPTATATYACSAGKSITAVYYDGETKAATSPDQPPTPGGSVALTLSDGRTMTLAQTISADGARYANADESIVFWNKGNSVTFMEGNQQTFTGCIQAATDPGGLPNVYANGTEGFSLRYPANYTVNEKYAYQALGPGKDINGVSFTIDPAIAKGTNLSTDSYVSVEELPSSTTCSADQFVSAGAGMAQTVVDGGTTYSVATSSDAGAGNRYEETVYAIPGTNPCIAVRYFIHYSVLENYPAGTVTAFDQNALMSQFDLIRRTLVIGQ